MIYCRLEFQSGFPLLHLHWGKARQQCLIPLSSTFIGFSTPHQNMYFHPGMIHSSLEWFFPDWNGSFQSKLPDWGKCSISRQWIKIRKKFFQIQFTNIEPEFWELVSYPNSCTSLERIIPAWNDLFQDGMICSRMEWIILQWKNIYCQTVEA